MSNKKLLSIVSISILILVSIFLFNKTGSPVGNVNVGAAYDDATWQVIKSFTGWKTNTDPSKVDDGANPNGQNTTANDGDRISIRNLGYDVFPAGTASTSETVITSLHNFRKRNGDNIMLRTYSTFVEYYEEENDTWTTLKTGLTSGKDFGWGDYNINTDQHSYTYFGNGSDSAMRWGGAHTILSATATSGATTLFVDDTSDFKFSTGTVILCGVENIYTSKTATTILLSSGLGAECTDNSGVAQAVETYSAHPKGDIYLVANNRIFIAGIASTSQAIYFSKYGDATDFVGASLVTDSTADAPGIFNLGEGGGSVIGMAQDENALYFFKKSIIYKATLNDALYTLLPLKPFDGKGQTVGAKSKKSIFTGGNTVFFITPDNQIMALQRVEEIDYPQVVPISSMIQETADTLNFSGSAGIVFRDKAYFAIKTTNSAAYNDSTLVWDIGGKKWDSPIVGVNAGDFIVYDDNTSEELYFSSSNSTNVYKVNETPTDDTFEVKANWRSKQFDFGMPEAQKEMTDVFVEGYISNNTSLTISLLLDEDGYTQKFSTTLLGTETGYIYNSSEYNVFGFNAFGTERFGSNSNLSNRKKFRAYMGKSFRAVPFYNAQIEFASDGENQGWEVTNFGFKVRKYNEQTKRSLYKEFR